MAEVGHGIVEVQELPIRWIVVEAVDGEIPPSGILLYRSIEIVPAILEVLLIGAERRDLYDLAAEEEMDDAEAPSDDPSIPEEALDLARRKRCRDVEVLRPAPQEHIADGSAYDVRLASRLLYLPYRPEGILVYLAVRDRVLLLRVDLGNRNAPTLSVILIAYEHSATLVEMEASRK